MESKPLAATEETLLEIKGLLVAFLFFFFYSTIAALFAVALFAMASISGEPGPLGLLVLVGAAEIAVFLKSLVLFQESRGGARKSSGDSSRVSGTEHKRWVDKRWGGIGSRSNLTRLR